MEQTVAEPTTSPAEGETTLNTLDRCDSCGAQAYVRAKFITGELLFCAHHYTKFEEKMSATILEVIDERWRLTEVAKLDVSPM